ncbi:LytTR family DNA-binding domain-containing protein [Aquimarina sp. ERC-38]|uniref:LytR/AlgR family response regulator transcription factor n=1 Tax=Aquimarina sp. ERC-38 TaxID=2949996 RepID=UPI002247B1D7|nr:LytTR family DNA-binding domain-containing protein [Aquimarina sp. ERC-38]UZO79567.1 LytTR family DNA-binding domain-containing protein [Aquimarina sp. ERC-38]
MVRCLLVDDESPAIALLNDHIKSFKDLEVIATAYSAVEAFEILKKEEIDLIFLDIEMPVLKGIDFLKTLKNPPKVIITTAYREYALDGYNLDIIDYLLKPISLDRFIKSIDRYYERVQHQLDTTPELVPTESYFFVNVNKKQIKVVFDDILYVESLKDYVRIHTTDQRIVVKSNIGKMATRLPSHLFLRTHRSFIVAIQKITAYTQRDIEIDTIEIPIGSSYALQVSATLTV